MEGKNRNDAPASPDGPKSKAVKDADASVPSVAAKAAADDDSPPTEVDLDQLAERELPKKKDQSRELEPIAKVGYKLALFVFFLICGTTLAIFSVAFFLTAPAVPPGPLTTFDAASVDQYQRAVDLYKQIGDLPLQRAKDLFQLIVITAFLPSFTAILGYIFGTRGGGSTRSTNDN